jgi:hypothetical protein
VKSGSFKASSMSPNSRISSDQTYNEVVRETGASFVAMEAEGGEKQLLIFLVSNREIAISSHGRTPMNGKR